MIEAIANSEIFAQSKSSERAEIIAWHYCRINGHEGSVSIKEICNYFETLHLPRPNETRLKEHFRRSQNIITSSGRFKPSRDFRKKMDLLFPNKEHMESSDLNLDEIESPPFIDQSRKEDLKIMVKAYCRLFLLENSIRGLIEHVLKNDLGNDWWNKAASSSMLKKHNDRVKNEDTNKWAPVRSDFGPLYALDWPDLITIMRKFEGNFLPYLKDIKFLHRYEDAGIFRNVVAHNGVIKEKDHIELIGIYHRDWVKQISN